MKIDLTCPVELWHYALPEKQYPFCRLQLFNMTEQTVVSVQAVFTCYDGEGMLLSRQVERVQRLDGRPRSAFEMTVDIQNGLNAAGMDFSVEKVWFEDGTVWRHTPGSGSEFVSNALPAGQRLQVLRSLAGPDAMGFPSDQGAVWLCVCGRPNAAGEDTCRRCGRSKRDVFTGFNEATVETVIFEQENAREEKERQERALAQQRAEQAEAARLRRRRITRRVTLAVVCTLLVLILAFGITFHGIPFYRFYTASRQMENGVYTTARAGFEDLAAQQGVISLPVRLDALGLDVDLLDISLYYKSAELAKECTYRQAAETMASGTLPALRTAQDAFDSLGDYRDSADQAREARYLRAQLLSASQQYESVVELCDSLGNYKDAPLLRSGAVYQIASSRMQEGQYTAAREQFLSLGGYQDSARQAMMCLYLPGLEALEAGDYQTAISLLTQLDSGFEKTGVRLQEAYYGLADQHFEQKDYETAAEYYLLAGDYLDAYSQAAACLYEPACLMMEQGDYAGAKEVFDRISSFRDALEKSFECVEEMGRQAMETGDYEAARLILGDALDYEPARLLLMDCFYLPAVELQQAGDYEGALELFASIAGYLDTDDRVLEIRYALADRMVQEGRYLEAAETFEELGDFSDSADRAMDARLSEALHLMDTGEYAQAIDSLTELEGWQDSEQYLRSAHYQLGKQLLEAGEPLDAALHFSLAEDHQDAQLQYQASMYALAEEAISQGRYDAAAEYLAGIPDYSDASLLRSQSIYHSAETEQEAGRLAEAAALFASIPDYEDASERANACYDAYYSEVYAGAREAFDAGDYGRVVSLLKDMSLENASSAYADIGQLYREANYLYANRLYEQKQPYEALVYYRNILDYKDVDRKLDRVCYRMLGTWVSRTGVYMEFRDDGTCTLDGKNYYFRGSQFSFFVGDKPDALNTEWTIFSCQNDVLSVQNNKTGSQYKLTRVTE